MQVYMDIFSERLKYERKFKGYTQKQMGAQLGISQTTYMHYELIGKPNGTEPSMEMIKKIADILDVSIDYLFGRED